MMQRTRPLKPPPRVTTSTERPMNRKLVDESQFDKDVRLEMQKLEQQFLLEQEAHGGPPINNRIVTNITVPDIIESTAVQRVPNVSPGMIFGPDKNAEKELKNRKQMEYRRQLDELLVEKSRYTNELSYPKEGSPIAYRDNFNDSNRYNDIRENILPKLTASTYDIPKASTSGLTIDTYVSNEVIPVTSSPQKSPTKARMRLISDVYGSEQVVTMNKNLLPDPNWRPSGKHISLKHTIAVQEQKQALEAQISETRKRKQEEVLKRRIEEQQEELRIKNELYQLNINEKPTNTAIKEMIKNDQVNHEINKLPLAAQSTINVAEKSVQPNVAVPVSAIAPNIHKHYAPAQLFNPGISSFHNNIPSSFNSYPNIYPEFRSNPPMINNIPPQHAQYYNSFRPTSAEEVDSFLVNWQRQVHEQAAQNAYFPSFYVAQPVRKDDHQNYVSDYNVGEFSSNSRFISPTEDPFVLLNAFRNQYIGNNKSSMESSLRSHSNFVDGESDELVRSPSNNSLNKSPNNIGLGKSPSNTSLGKSPSNTGLNKSSSDSNVRNEVEYDDNQLYDLADDDEEGIMP